MSRADLARTHCSVARAIERVGDPWTLMILREMFLGSRRFDDLQRHTGVSPNILSQRLKQLCADGILRSRSYCETPPRKEYLLTDKGLDLWPVIVMLRAWGERWLSGGDAPSIRLTHHACGGGSGPVLVCADCGEPVGGRDYRSLIGPEMQAERDATGAIAQGKMSRG